MEVSQSFCSCETPFKMVSRLRNGGSLGVEKIAAISQLRNGGTWLRNRTRVPWGLFAAAKIFAEEDGRLRNHFVAGRHFRRGSLLLRNFAAHSLSLLFELLLIPNFLFSPILTFFLILIIPKTYVT